MELRRESSDRHTLERLSCLLVFHRNTSVMPSMKCVGVQIDRTAGRSAPPQGLVSLAELLCGRTTSRFTSPHRMGLRTKNDRSLLLPHLSYKPPKWHTILISVKSMAIYLKIPYYFFTNLNFQRLISYLTLIWDPLKFYHI